MPQAAQTGSALARPAALRVRRGGDPARSYRGRRGAVREASAGRFQPSLRCCGQRHQSPGLGARADSISAGTGSAAPRASRRQRFPEGAGPETFRSRVRCRCRRGFLPTPCRAIRSRCGCRASRNSRPAVRRREAPARSGPRAGSAKPLGERVGVGDCPLADPNPARSDCESQNDPERGDHHQDGGAHPQPSRHGPPRGDGWIHPAVAEIQRAEA